MLVSKTCLSVLALEAEDMNVAVDVFSSPIDELYFPLPESLRQKLDELRGRNGSVLLTVALRELDASGNDADMSGTHNERYFISRTAAYVLGDEMGDANLMDRALNSDGRFVALTEEEKQRLVDWVSEYYSENLPRIIDPETHTIRVDVRDMRIIVASNELSEAASLNESVQ